MFSDINRLDVTSLIRLNYNVSGVNYNIFGVNHSVFGVIHNIFGALSIT